MDPKTVEVLHQILLKTNSVSSTGTEVLISPAPPPELDYNERFDFNDVSSMELDRTLEKGLPYPILKVVEYLSVDRTGFLWGKQYRLAGYYTYCMLCRDLRFAFACWLLQMLLLCAVPHCFAQAMLTVGWATLLADFIYAVNVPQQLAIRFPGPENTASVLQFSFSTCFFATLSAGIASVLFGMFLWLLQARTGYVFETFLSAYLDEMCRRRRGKDPPDPPDPPSNSILLMRHRHRTIHAIAQQLNPAANSLSLPSTPLTMLGSSLPSCSTQRISPMSETELLSVEEGGGENLPKQSTASSFGAGAAFEELCLTASSCGGSLKSLTQHDSPPWLGSSPRQNAWADSNTREATESRPDSELGNASSGYNVV